MGVPKFTIHDPKGKWPSFSEDAVIEIKTRDDRVLTTDMPWMAMGWDHTGSPNDILEYRLLQGKMSIQK